MFQAIFCNISNVENWIKFSQYLTVFERQNQSQVIWKAWSRWRYLSWRSCACLICHSCLSFSGYVFFIPCSLKGNIELIRVYTLIPVMHSQEASIIFPNRIIRNFTKCVNSFHFAINLNRTPSNLVKIDFVSYWSSFCEQRHTYSFLLQTYGNNYYM